MNKKAVISNVIVSVIVDLLFAGLLIGAGALVLAVPEIFGIVLNVAFALIGISLVLTTIPNLIGGIVSIKQKKGVFDLIFSIVTMVIGVVLTVYGIISALIAIGITGVGVPHVVSLLMSVIHWVVCGLTALYLIVLPIIRIVKAEKKFMQLKAELVKMIFGILIVVLLVCGLLAAVLNQFIGLTLIVVGALTAILAVVQLIVGIVGLNKADKNTVKVDVDVDGDGVADVAGVVIRDETPAAEATEE